MADEQDSPRSSAAVTFNREHGTTLTEFEYVRRSEKAEPYKLFMALGGAGKKRTLLGEHTSIFNEILRKAINATGSDDPNVLDDWVNAQIRTVMGMQDQVVVSKEQAASDVMAHSAGGPDG